MFSNEHLLKLSYAELIDASNLIKGSYLEEIFENDNNGIKSIITTEQVLRFICNSELKLHSACHANLYDDKAGKITLIS